MGRGSTWLYSWYSTSVCGKVMHWSRHMPGNEDLVLHSSEWRLQFALTLIQTTLMYRHSKILVKVPIHINLLLYVASRVTPELVVQVLSLYTLGRKSTWKSPDSHPSVT